MTMDRIDLGEDIQNGTGGLKVTPEVMSQVGWRLAFSWEVLPSCVEAVLGGLEVLGVVF